MVNGGNFSYNGNLYVLGSGGLGSVRVGVIPINSPYTPYVEYAQLRPPVSGVSQIKNYFNVTLIP